MSIRGQAVIVGAYEHPRPRDPGSHDRPDPPTRWPSARWPTPGSTLADVDAYFCDSTAPGFGPVSMAEYLGLAARYFDRTETGGSSYLAHVGHAAAAIAAGKCRVALITLAGRPRTGGAPARRRPADGRQPGGGLRDRQGSSARWATTPCPRRATCTSSARRASSWRGSRSRPRSTPSTTRTPSCPTRSRSTRCSARRWWPTRCTASTAAWSPTAAARSWWCTPTWPDPRPGGRDRCSATARRSSTATPAASTSPTPRPAGSGPAAFAEAGVDPGRHPVRVDLRQLHDHGAHRPRGPRLLREGRGRARSWPTARLRSPGGRLPFNTDGGGLCNNHPANRGGMTKVIEAVRQLRGEAHPAVQVPGLRARPRPRHRRRAVDAPRQRHARARSVSDERAAPGRAAVQPRGRARSGRRPPTAASCCPVCDACGHHIWYPRSWCPVCGQRRGHLDRAERSRHRLRLHGDPQGHGPLGGGGARSSAPTSSSTRARASSPTSSPTTRSPCTSAWRSPPCSCR